MIPPLALAGIVSATAKYYWTPRILADTITADQLRDHCRAHLADFKVPEYVEFRDEPLPRNPAGKVLKAALRGADTAFAASDDQAL